MNKKPSKSHKKQRLLIYVCASLIACLIFSMGCCYKINSSQVPKTDNLNSQPDSSNSGTDETAKVSGIQGETSSVESVETTDALEAENELRNNFEKLKSGEKDPGKILKFLKENISDADQALADEIIYFNFNVSESTLEKFTDNYADSEIQNAIYSEFNGSTDLEELKTSQNRKLAIIAQETIDRNYKLFSVEGFVAPLVDYKAYSIYRQYLSKEMNDYMDILQAESDMPSAVDAGLTISLEDFVGRIMAAYEFVDNYPSSKMLEQIKNMRSGKIWIYFAGIDNTPVFDFDNIILPGRLKNFQETETKLENTDFGELLKEYLDLLEKENYTRTQKINDYLEKLFNA
jgi:hypothetical protein